MTGRFRTWRTRAVVTSSLLGWLTLTGCLLLFACVVLFQQPRCGAKSKSSDSSTPPAPLTPVVSAPPAAKWHVANVKSGAVLRGWAQINLTTQEQPSDDSAFSLLDPTYTLLVDGKKVDYIGIDMGSVPKRSRTATSFMLDTDTYKNGPHTLTILGENNTKQEFNVTFNNDVSQIYVEQLYDPGYNVCSPPHETPTAPFRATLTKPGPWTVSVRLQGNPRDVVRTYRGYGAKIQIEWDGKNKTGLTVLDDCYEVVFKAGNSQQEHISIITKRTMYTY